MAKVKNKRNAGLADKVHKKKKAEANKKKLNPFEVHINKEKLKVLGKKSKHDRGLPGVSRARAIQKRKETLGTEMKLINKTNTFIDRRIGEKNNQISAEDRMIARFAAERAKQHSKKNIYNLADDEVLTHRGQTLEQIEKFDDPRSDDDDEDGMKFGGLGDEFVSEGHFGGGVLSKSDSKDGAKSHKDLIEQLIAESKKRKAEKQKEKEQTLDLTEKLDSEWKDLQPVVFKKQKVPEESLIDKLLSKAETGQDYDKMMRELKFEKRGTPSDGLKSKEKQDEEERKKIEELERQRDLRMLSEEDMVAPKNTKPVKHRSADDLEDNFELDNEQDFMLAYDKDGKPLVPDHVLKDYSVPNAKKKFEDGVSDTSDEEDGGSEEESDEENDDKADDSDADTDSNEDSSDELNKQDKIDNKNKKAEDKVDNSSEDTSDDEDVKKPNKIETTKTKRKKEVIKKVDSDEDTADDEKEVSKANKKEKIKNTSKKAKEKIVDSGEDSSDDENEVSKPNKYDKTNINANEKRKKKVNKTVENNTNEEERDEYNKLNSQDSDEDTSDNDSELETSNKTDTTKNKINNESKDGKNLKRKHLSNSDEKEEDTDFKNKQKKELNSKNFNKSQNKDLKLNDSTHSTNAISDDDNDDDESESSEESDDGRPNIRDLNDLKETDESGDEDKIEDGDERIGSFFDFKSDVGDNLKELLKGKTPSQQSIALQKLIKSYDPGLSENNKELLSRLFAHLLQYIHDVFTNLTNEGDLLKSFLIFDSLVPYFYDLIHINKVSTKKFLVELLKEKYDSYKRNPRKVPDLNTLIFFKLVSVLYPTSDFRHPVATPSLIFMSEILTSARFKDAYSVSRGFFIISLILEYTVLSKRYVPSALNFLRGVFYLCANTSVLNPIQVVPPFRLHKTAKILNLERDCSKMAVEQKLAGKDLIASEIDDSFKIRCLLTATIMLKEFFDNYIELEALEAIFEPHIKLLGRVDLDLYPKKVSKKVTEVLQEMKQTLEVKTYTLMSREKVRPKALRLYEPDIQDVFTGSKNSKLSKESAEKARLQGKYKKEMKGALREIRRDKAYIASVKIRQKIQSDNIRKEKVKQIYKDASIQQGELNKLKRMK